MPTTWEERVKPSTDWSIRQKPETERNGRVRPTTDWEQRWSVETDWSGRVKPMTYMTPLQDAYTEVADEDDEVIYILANSGKLIPATFWKARPQII